MFTLAVRRLGVEDYREDSSTKSGSGSTLVMDFVRTPHVVGRAITRVSKEAFAHENPVDVEQSAIKSPENPD